MRAQHSRPSTAGRSVPMVRRMGSTWIHPRPKHAVTGRSLQFDLEAEVTQLRREDGYAATGHNAKTLVKHSEMRLVLMVLRAGTRLQEHAAEHQVALQVLDGVVRVRLNGGPTQVAAGTLLALDRSVPHDVQAVEDTTMLLTVAAH